MPSHFYCHINPPSGDSRAGLEALSGKDGDMEAHDEAFVHESSEHIASSNSEVRSGLAMSTAFSIYPTRIDNASQLLPISSPS
jgi:hypothetical protein